jgi:hypothetical protein
LRNLTDESGDLSGYYLGDEPGNPRKWQFPVGTVIAPEGFLIVWADEDDSATSGLDASFKLTKAGEEIFLNDTDAHFNATLDHITVGSQQNDVSFGRSGSGADVWNAMFHRTVPQISSPRGRESRPTALSARSPSVWLRPESCGFHKRKQSRCPAWPGTES